MMRFANNIMGLSMLCFLIISIISTSIHLVEAKMSVISRQEELELEKQIQILNKPPIKTIQTKEGDIIDCIDINKQSALDHPLLKNHKIQKKPSSFPIGMGKRISSRSKTSTLLLKKREACPVGTVPIKRTQKEDLLNAKSLSQEITAQNQRFPLQHVVSIRTKAGGGELYYGGVALMSVYNLTVVDDQFSSSQIWVQSGSYQERNVITAGWRVSPKMYGDNLTRLFTYWTGDGYKGGCYNTLCRGFVQVHKTVTPSYPLAPTSTYGGIQKSVKVMIYKDPLNWNWWLVLDDNIQVGYWPRELFTHMADRADTVAYGGTASAGKNGVSPPMGSGHKPDGNSTHSAFFWDVRIVNENDYMRPLGMDEAEEFINKSDCYSLQNYKYDGPFQGSYSFAFGGPGGTNC